MNVVKDKKMKGRVWTELESRLAASIVYRELKKRPFASDYWTLLEGQTFGGLSLPDLVDIVAPLTTEEVLHAILWMRGKGVDVRVFARSGEAPVYAVVIPAVES